MPLNLSSVRKLSRVSMLALALLVVSTTAQAYTIVLRGGKTVQVSNIVSFTTRTITYEVGTGFQVTLQLAAIDIAATERANGEAPGSFQSRIQSSLVQPPQDVASTAQTQRRTVTNRDLQSFAGKRREGEIAYERRRKELGLPSPEASRQRAIAENASMRARSEQQQAEQREGEAVWRERAVNLRSEIAATDAEISSIRQQLDSLPSNNLNVVTGYDPYLGGAYSGVSPYLVNPALQPGFLTPQIGPALGGFGRVFSRGPIFGGLARGIYGGAGQYSGYYPSFGGAPYDLSYERSALVTRLNELTGRRAGLAARWQALEESARRVGAMPGWLRR
jgi:hypothetical protein